MLHPPAAYTRTLIALLVLLGLTVGAWALPLGAFETPANLAIALAKGALVAVVFMHLKRATPLTRLFAAAGLLWLGLMMMLTLADFLTR